MLLNIITVGQTLEESTVNKKAPIVINERNNCGMQIILHLNQETIEKLEVKSPNDIMLLNIITVGQTLEESTVNMKAPIVINVRNNCGMQIILQDEEYSIWHPLLRGDGGC